MAGYPSNYAWNEDAKACQAGYLDASGVFHSTASTTRSGVPNTYDKGILGDAVSFSVASIVAVIAAAILKKTR
jgi:hypothetical protein